MGAITLLPKLLQHQIAAGEVIERPISVVKELVENSIDSGATDIEVELTNGGMDAILVRDNGCGMSREDAILSVERHATSKISTKEDLFAITSFGFRGEALASISSVSDFTLTTKRAEDLSGTSIHLRGEEFLDTEVAGVPDGTQIHVKDLFFNMPARKKFLKKDTTELRHIMKHMSDVALAHPDLSLSVKHNGKTLLDLRPTSLGERISNVIGSTFLEQTVPVHFDQKGFHVSGYIMTPAHLTATKKQQLIFVNKRPVQSSLIHRAVMEGYHRIIAGRIVPNYVLFLEVDPSIVDVNVHPRKLEVRFENTNMVFTNVRNAVAHVLEKGDIAPSIGAPSLATAHTTSRSTPSYSAQGGGPRSSTPSGGTGKAKSPYAPALRPSMQDAIAFTKEMLGGSYTDLPFEAPDVHSDAPYRFLGQLHRCYLLVQDQEGLRLIDQHAAHERVRFERLKASLATQSLASQQFMQPEILELTPEERALFVEKQEELQEAGFILEDVGDGSLHILGIPEDLHGSKHCPSSKEAVLNILHDFDGLVGGCDHKGDELRTFREKLIAYTACRGAVQFGDELNQMEIDQLLKDFYACPNKHTCPHGRTSMIIFSLNELKKFFDR